MTCYRLTKLPAPLIRWADFFLALVDFKCLVAGSFFMLLCFVQSNALHCQSLAMHLFSTGNSSEMLRPQNLQWVKVRSGWAWLTNGQHIDLTAELHKSWLLDEFCAKVEYSFWKPCGYHQRTWVIGMKGALKRKKCKSFMMAGLNEWGIATPLPRYVIRVHVGFLLNLNVILWTFVCLVALPWVERQIISSSS